MKQTYITPHTNTVALSTADRLMDFTPASQFQIGGNTGQTGKDEGEGDLDLNAKRHYFSAWDDELEEL